MLCYAFCVNAEKGGATMFNSKEFDAAIAKKGSTRREAAQVMGMNPATLYKKTVGKSDFYRKEIESFCIFYEVRPDHIFFAEQSA